MTSDESGARLAGYRRGANSEGSLLALAPHRSANGLSSKVGRCRWRLISQLPDTIYSNYLPIVSKSTFTSTGQGIYGRVTYRGTVAAGIPLALRFYDGSAWSTLMTTVTDAEGGYSFTSVPTLSGGQAYYVLYGPNTSDPSYLYAWFNNPISEYVTGQSYPGGDFDIADVALIAPNTEETVPLPVTFSWTPRPTQALETYDVEVFYPDLAQSFFGSVKSGTFSLATPIPVLASSQLYGWDVWVNNEWGTGISFDLFLVKFSSTASHQQESSEMTGSGLSLQREWHDAPQWHQ